MLLTQSCGKITIGSARSTLELPGVQKLIAVILQCETVIWTFHVRDMKLRTYRCRRQPAAQYFVLRSVVGIRSRLCAI